MNFYFDSSGIAKKYVAEVGSDWVIATTSPESGNNKLNAAAQTEGLFVENPNQHR